MINEAIILAGGLGTRLRSVVSELPKCMAPVAGKPFLHYVITHLQQQGATHFILSVGYKSESIVEYINAEYANAHGLKFIFSTEDQPLGTGGAINFAVQKVTDNNVLVCNGDTLFSIDINTLTIFHEEHNADCTLSLKPMKNFDRYGVVQLNNGGTVQSFSEKQFYSSGLINGGIYTLNVESFKKENFPLQFSYEKDYLEKYVGQRKMFGVVQDKYFIDIGIPEDYERAQNELKFNNQV